MALVWTLEGNGMGHVRGLIPGKLGASLTYEEEKVCREVYAGVRGSQIIMNLNPLSSY